MVTQPKCLNHKVIFEAFSANHSFEKREQIDKFSKIEYHGYESVLDKKTLDMKNNLDPT